MLNTHTQSIKSILCGGGGNKITQNYCLMATHEYIITDSDVISICIRRRHQYRNLSSLFLYINFDFIPHWKRFLSQFAVSHIAKLNQNTVDALLRHWNRFLIRHIDTMKIHLSLNIFSRAKTDFSFYAWKLLSIANERLFKKYSVDIGK